MVKPQNIKDQSGQATVESILLIVLLTILALGISTQFKEKNILSKITSGPWLVLDGMIQHGAWKDSNASSPHHPNLHRSSFHSETP